MTMTSFLWFMRVQTMEKCGRPVKSKILKVFFSYQHIHHNNGHSKYKHNEQNIGERRKGQVVPWKEVIMVVHFPQSHHKHRHH